MIWDWRILIFMDSLAVKYRPKTFEEVSGQSYTIDILKEQLKNKNIKNGYLFSGASGCGKALHPNTKVYIKRDNGDCAIIPISELQINDKVLHKDGNYYSLNGIYPQEENNSYKISFTDGSVVKTDENHLWVVIINRKEYIYSSKELYELLIKNKRLGIKISLINTYYGYERKDLISENQALLLGILYHYSYRPNKADYLILYIPNRVKNKEYIDNLYKILDNEKVKYEILEKSSKEELIIKVYDGLINNLIHNFKEGYSSISYNILNENWIVGISIKLRMKIIEGFFYFNKVNIKRDLSFTSPSLDFYKSFRRIIKSVGGRVMFYENQVSLYDNSLYRITVYLTNGMLDELGLSNYKLKYDRKIYAKIVYIKPLSNKEKHICISVNSPDNTFICGEFLNTHNTTIARIFARELNGDNNNITELDAASNNSVDDVRNLIKDANYTAIGNNYKIYIIDECHSISNTGWQAFLKTLEEPPAGAIFIFCTTEPQKIPLTIQNRLQHFVFTRMDNITIEKRLKEIVEAEGLNEYIDKKAIEYIAKTAHGGMRDGITNLDKVISLASSKVDSKEVAKILSIADYEALLKVIRNLNKKDTVINIINELYEDGTDLKIFITDFIKFIIELLKSDLIGIDKTDIPNGYYKDIENLSVRKNYQIYSDLLSGLMSLKNSIIYETYCKPFIEAFFIQFQVKDN